MTAQELKAWRREHGYTQAELAQELGISRPTVARYESWSAPELPRWLPLALRGLEIQGRSNPGPTAL